MSRKKEQVRKSKERKISPTQAGVFARMRKGLGRIEWMQRAKSPKPNTYVGTLVDRENRKGRPMLIHDSKAKGTFYGNLKQAYKFGPAFPNKDRRDKVSRAKSAQDRAKRADEKRERTIVRKRLFQRIADWFRNIFKSKK